MIRDEDEISVVTDGRLRLAIICRPQAGESDPSDLSYAEQLQHSVKWCSVRSILGDVKLGVNLG